MPNWIGDLVMATPILRDLHRQWPEASLTAMCQSSAVPLLENNPNLTEIYAFKKPSGWIHRAHPLDIIENLQHGEYDLGILLTNSFSSALWFWRGHVAHRIGFKTHFRSLLLNTAVPFPANKETQHLVHTYKALLGPLGIPLSDTPPELFVTPQEKEAAAFLLSTLKISPQNKIVGINPGAAYGSAKCWMPDRFREVTEKLVQDPEVVVLYFGDQAGAPLIHKILSELEEKGMSERVVNLAGKTTLRMLMALFLRCSAILTNDSGPMHIASALRIPLVALFGSTSDVKTGPYNGGVVIHKHVECSPCYKRVCPIDFRCMKRIEVDEVYQALKKQMR